MLLTASIAPCAAPWTTSTSSCSARTPALCARTGASALNRVRACEPGACSPRRRSPCDRYRSLAEEVAADTAQKGDLASEMWEHGEMNPLKWCARCCSNSSY